MTPPHIAARRERARRRRRRVVGAMRLGIFVSMVLTAGFAIVGIGAAGEQTATEPAVRAQTAPPSPADRVNDAATPAAATVRPTARPRPRPSSTSTATIAAAPGAPAAVRPGPAGTGLPMTGAPETRTVALLGALIVLLGMLLQIAVQPVSSRPNPHVR